MDEATTTEVQSETTADSPQVEESQVESTTETPAEDETTETTTDPKDEALEDEDLKWLKSKGIDPGDTKAVAKAYRDAEREFHKTRQEAKQSLKTQAREAVKDDGDSNLENEVRQLRVGQQVAEFRNGLRDRGMDKDQIDEIDAEMATVIESRPYLANDLEAVYAIVRSSKYGDDIKAAEERGRTAAKQSLGKASAAKAPSGNAQVRTESPTEDDKLIQAFREGWNQPI